MPRILMSVVIALAVLVGCKPAGEAAPQPSVAASASPDAAAAPSATAAAASSERFIAIGTEPFWNVTIKDGKATYSTPEDPNGQSLAVEVTHDGASRRFAGTFKGQPFVLNLRPETCSDGMSDRRYGHAADLAVGGESLRGCADPGTALKPE